MASSSADSLADDSVAAICDHFHVKTTDMTALVTKNARLLGTFEQKGATAVVTDGKSANPLTLAVCPGTWNVFALGLLPGSGPIALIHIEHKDGILKTHSLEKMADPMWFDDDRFPSAARLVWLRLNESTFVHDDCVYLRAGTDSITTLASIGDGKTTSLVIASQF